MWMRGVRGATTAEANTREAILTATSELLQLMIEANQIAPDDVASAIFTTTIDLNADYPALAARALGWHDVALLCMHEMNVPHGLKMCIRILLHWNTAVPAQDVTARVPTGRGQSAARSRFHAPIVCTFPQRNWRKMVIVMQHGASAKQISAIVARVESIGLSRASGAG